MVRVMNFFCLALMGLSILALYHVSERTRDARLNLAQVDRQIVRQQSDIAVLQTEWQHVASPARIQQLAQTQLGMTDTASVRLASFDLLPRRDAPRPLNNTPLRNANAVVPSPIGHAIPISAPVTSAPVPGM